MYKLPDKVNDRRLKILGPSRYCPRTRVSLSTCVKVRVFGIRWLLHSRFFMASFSLTILDGWKSDNTFTLLIPSGCLARSCRSLAFRLVLRPVSARTRFGRYAENIAQHVTGGLADTPVFFGDVKKGTQRKSFIYDDRRCRRSHDRGFFRGRSSACRRRRIEPL